MEKVITFNREAIKANREARKKARADKRAEREANKKPINVGKTIGIVGSYAAVAGAAAVTAVKIMQHMAGQEAQMELEGLHPVEEAPFDTTDVEGVET